MFAAAIVGSVHDEPLVGMGYQMGSGSLTLILVVEVIGIWVALHNFPVVFDRMI